ncbi:hypothetical protein GJ744_009905 [Endocarpon pusillum]|uniref:Thioesterase domain-containing protein n=1 Tax=Endocarpon pusillum TaxID=364733 RepID=A0A8H7AF84_9EURO|nr:hypothetical protein GJ744_009905 [Endocarpon pusillum]
MRNFGTYFDTANKRLWTEMASSRGTGLILRSIKVDYKFPMTWPDRISVFHKLRFRPDERSESIILDVVILSESRQRPAARCLEDVVVYDYRTSRRTTLPPFMLDQFQRTFELQETARFENESKIHHLLNRVRDIERNTWDRPDAREDLGTARS